MALSTYVLTVYAGGQVYPYDAARRLHAGEKPVSQQTSEKSVEMADVALVVGSEFLGHTPAFADGEPVGDPLDGLPDDGGEGFRATLSFDRGDDTGAQRVMEGLVYASEIDFDTETRSFGLTLLGAAEEEAWAKLEAIRLRRGFSVQALAVLSGSLLDVWTVRPYDLDAATAEELGIGNDTFAQLYEQAVSVAETRINERALHVKLPSRSVLTVESLAWACLVEAGLLLDAERHPTGPPPPRYTVQYYDGDTVRSYTRPARLGLFQEQTWEATPPTSQLNVPDWTGRQLVEAYLELTGQRLSARFVNAVADSAPRRVRIGFMRDTSPSASEGGLAPFPSLDGRARSPRRYATADPQAEDAALAFQNRLDEPSIQQKPYTSDQHEAGGLPRGLFYYAVPPPARAVYAAARWEPVDEGGTSGEQGFRAGDHDNLVGLPFRYPQVSLPAGFALPHVQTGTVTEQLRLGSPLIENEQAHVYLVPVTEALGQARMVIDRTMVSGLDDAGEPPPGQPVTYNEGWADTLLQQRALSRSSLATVSGDFDLRGVLGPDGTAAVGDPERGVTLGGIPYVIGEAEFEARLGGGRVQLVRARRTPPVPAPGPAGINPPLDVRVEATKALGRNEVLFAVRWNVPDPTGSLPMGYEVARFDRSERAWEQAVSTLATERIWFVDYDGGNTPETIQNLFEAFPQIFRARAVYRTGERSSWVSAVANLGEA